MLSPKVRFWMLVVASAAAAGCRSPSALPAFASRSGGPAGSVDQRSLPADENPLRRPDRDLQRFSPDGTSAATGGDSETLRQIDRELAGADPAQREQILADLRQASPAEARQILTWLKSQRRARSPRVTPRGFDAADRRAADRDGDWTDGFERGRNVRESPLADRRSENAVTQIGHADWAGGNSRPDEVDAADRNGIGSRVARNEAEGPPEPRDSPGLSRRSANGSDVAGFRGNGTGLFGGRFAVRNPRNPESTDSRSRSNDEGGGFASRLSLPGLGFSRRNREPRTRSRTDDDRGSQTAPQDDPAGEWDRSLRRLLAIADAQTANLKKPTPRDELAYIRKHVYRRMLSLLAGDPQQAIDAIPGIDASDSEFWQNTMWGITDYFREDSISDKSSRATQTISRFRTAIQRLREQADLEIRNLVFCRKITNYGNYETVAATEFRPGEQVLIYAEIDNFKSELTADGRYRTRLKSTVEIYHDAPGGGRAAEPYEFAPTEDLCRNFRRDYFHSYIIDLPARLPLGNYKLKLTVEDTLGGKVATDTIRFKVN